MTYNDIYHVMIDHIMIHTTVYMFNGSCLYPAQDVALREAALRYLPCLSSHPGIEQVPMLQLLRKVRAYMPCLYFEKINKCVNIDVCICMYI